jgi:hypothetical protein
MTCQVSRKFIAPGKGNKMQQVRFCKECGASFEPTRPNQVFDGRKCRFDFNNRIRSEKVKFANERGFLNVPAPEEHKADEEHETDVYDFLLRL